jgi:hypothetical protein
VWLAFLISAIALILLINLIQLSDREVMQHQSFLTLLGRNAMYVISIASNHSTLFYNMLILIFYHIFMKNQIKR